jgi:hypothetical protein
VGVLDNGESLWCPTRATSDGVEASDSAPSEKNLLRSPILENKISGVNFNTDIVIIGELSVESKLPVD